MGGEEQGRGMDEDRGEQWVGRGRGGAWMRIVVSSGWGGAGEGHGWGSW